MHPTTKNNRDKTERRIIFWQNKTEFFRNDICTSHPFSQPTLLVCIRAFSVAPLFFHLRSSSHLLFGKSGWIYAYIWYGFLTLFLSTIAQLLVAFRENATFCRKFLLSPSTGAQAVWGMGCWIPSPTLQRWAMPSASASRMSWPPRLGRRCQMGQA